MRADRVGHGKRDVGSRISRLSFPRPTSRYPLVVALVATTSCSWFTDFKQQPKVDPWESPADTIAPRANPQMSVPIYGTAAPGFAFGRAASIGAVEDRKSNV